MSVEPISMEQLEQFTNIATDLKQQGYNRAVVVRRLIVDHKMPEPTAINLVSELYGKRADPRKGDTRHGVLSGLVQIFLGLSSMGVIAYFLGYPVTPTRIFAWGCALLTVGRGISTLVLALVNVNAKEDLVDSGPNTKVTAKDAGEKEVTSRPLDRTAAAIEAFWKFWPTVATKLRRR